MLNRKDLPEAQLQTDANALQLTHGSQHGNATAAPSAEHAAASDRNAHGRFVPGNRAAQRARVAPERFEGVRAQLAARYAGSPLPAPIREPLIAELAHTCTAAEVQLEAMARFGLVSERGRRRPAYLAYLGLMERAAAVIALLDPPSKRGGKRRVDPQQALADLRALAAAQKG
jgi:hypothetical protein